MDGIMTYWPVVATLLTIFVLPGLGWIVRKGLASQADLAAAIDGEAKRREAGQKALEDSFGSALKTMSDVQAQLANRTLKIEAELEHIPTTEDLNEIRIELSRTSSKLDGLDRETQSITRALTRVENHLLKGATT